MPDALLTLLHPGLIALLFILGLAAYLAAPEPAARSRRWLIKLGLLSWLVAMMLTTTCAGLGAKNTLGEYSANVETDTAEAQVVTRSVRHTRRKNYTETDHFITLRFTDREGQAHTRSVEVDEDEYEASCEGCERRVAYVVGTGRDPEERAGLLTVILWLLYLLTCAALTLLLVRALLTGRDQADHDTPRQPPR